jgi:hypothetical protein
MDQVGWHDGADFIVADLGVVGAVDVRRAGSRSDRWSLDMRRPKARARQPSGSSAHPSRHWPPRSTRTPTNRTRGRSRRLVAERGALTTTRALARAVLRWLDECRAKMPTRASAASQTLRIEVNDEFGVLEALCGSCPAACGPAVAPWRSRSIPGRSPREG